MFNFLLFNAVLSTLWFVRQIRATLFWLYLWQLKEYHIGRFIDHFRTEKGKRIFLNVPSFFKLFLLFSLLVTRLATRPGLVVICVLLTLYIFELVKATKNFFQKRLLKPVLTQKTVFLISIALIFQIFLLFSSFEQNQKFPTFLLFFDILTPGIVSGIVLTFQPFVALARNQIIKKAKRKRRKFRDLIVIGITGSYGKTSTKEFLATILEEKFKVLKTKEHQNSEVGISQCILDELKEEHEIFICEMGAYNRGGIKLLCDIVKPKIGIVTGVNEQHLATFGTMENLLSAEGGRELIESLPEDGIAFFNAKNKYCLELYNQTKIKKFLYGQEVKLTGLENIEGAKLVAKELGMTEKETSTACDKIENKFPGIQIKKACLPVGRGINELNIIDATYSANPDGVISHLEYLKTWPGKKVIIMPCLIELGPASKEVHKRIGGKIGEVCDLAIITTKERLREIRDEAIKNEMKEEDILLIENPKEIIEKIKTFCVAGDTILLESRVPKEVIDLLNA